MSPTTQQPQRNAPGALVNGLVVFASVMLIVGGVLDVLRGIMAIAEDEIFVSTPDYTFAWDVTGWGWAHLLLGVLAVVVGMGLFAGRLWARVLGVVIAAVLLVANFLSLPYYPIWSIVLIAFYVLVIGALCEQRRDDS
ncbi:DUF7144 family membrane protein [Allostreptomyces psammosilenae]|uniref:DUF7144 domain-containing protein n=1 Tax=Allostreptomyces psammosilenae TaxID=1892865 RepID=A0A853A1E6_9ACTN|nr:hypothetical protein [Allostreptomyces psammosilenae]NYI07270.1 hypothetical protein [Allostreptomyces psammosilenae]